MRTISLSCGLLVAVLAFPAGCATIVNPSTQPVTIVSDPPAAEVIVGSEEVGSTPTDVRLFRSDSDAALRLQKDGFAPRVVRPRRTLSRWLIANLVVPALPSATLVSEERGEAFAGMAGTAFLTDLFITGDGFAFADTVHTELTPTPNQSRGLRPRVDTTMAPELLLRSVGSGLLDAPASPAGRTAVQ